MRLAVCTLSAVLLSGCSWLGLGGGNSNSHGYSYGYGGAYDCAPVQQYAYGYQQGYQSQGCGPAGGYQVASTGYGQGGHGQAGYAGGLRGPQQGGVYGQQQMAGYGYNSGSAYASNGTVLGANAPYGAAVNGQYGAAGAGNVQTIQGAPIYVPQPYPAQQQAAYYNGGYAAGGGCGYTSCGGGSLPFGLEAGIGTDLAIGGDLFPGEVSKPFLGGPGNVSDLDPISYDDAFENAVHYDLAATYDLDPATTVLARVGYSKADGNRMQIGTVTDGAVTEDLYAEFGELEQVTLEGGVRRYMGGWNNGTSGVRPYVGATAGFGYNYAVDLTQSSTTLVDPTLFNQTYIEAGWHPTASGVIGAEMQVGARTALGLEAGIRWSDDLDTNFQSDDRWSVPLRLRGRVSF